MSPLKDFIAYAADFEKTYADDDWSRLEKYFTEDVVYEVRGAEAYSCRIKGRDAMFAGMKRSVDGFDRRCERTGGLRGTPSEDGDRATISWTVSYTRGDSPEIQLLGRSEVEFSEGRIQRMVDTFEEFDGPAYQKWMENYGEGLNASYV